MKLIFAALALALSSPAFAEPHLISMISSNAVETELPIGVLVGKPFQANPEAKYVKLHLYMDKPLEKVFKVEIEACKDWAEARAEQAFENFNEVTSSGDGYWGPEGIDIKRPVKNILALTYTEDGETKSTFPKMDSLTINFGPTENICIKSVSFFDKNNVKLAVQGPEAVEGSVLATSVQLPIDAYSPENLFDSKFENAWATNKVTLGAATTFNYAGTTRIEKIKIWNGYQRSVIHCQQNSRVKSMTFTGDNGYSETITIKDKLGSQEIVLPKPFMGKSLTMTVKDVAKGNSYQDLVISELRFYSGKEWFLINPLKHFQGVAKKNREQFKVAKLQGMLDGEYATDLAEGNWKFRLRSDGSAFILGFVPGEELGTSYSALGNFEIKSVDDKSMRIRAFGFLYKGKYGMDCNGCGVACNSPGKQEDVGEKIFQQNFSLSAIKDSVQVVNESKSGKLKFTKLTLTNTGK